MRRVAVGVTAGILAIVAVTLVAVLFGSSKPVATSPSSTLATIPSCQAPSLIAGVRVPAEIGTWRVHEVEAGAFDSLEALPSGELLALQACGSDESSLRVLEIDPRNGSGVASAPFDKAAPIASALGQTPSAVWLGLGRLALQGSAAAPYELSLAELNASSLHIERTIPLGRGYGLTLVDGPGGTLVASTGRQLLAISATGTVRTLASFPGVVVQHIVVVPHTGEALVTLFTPSAVPPASSTTVAMVGLATGEVSGELRIPAGKEIESLASASRESALVVVSSKGTTAIERLSLTGRLRLSSTGSHGVEATLSSMTLAASQGDMFVVGPVTLACVSPETGAVESSTDPSGPAEQTSSLLASGRGIYAVTTAGIGLVSVPAGCRS